jgi:hypothetical protein
MWLSKKQKICRLKILHYFIESFFFLLCVDMLGLGISDKNLFRKRLNGRNKWLVPTEFRLVRGTENSRNSIPNHSVEEKTIRNSVRWNKNTVEANFRNFVPKHFADENMLTVLFSGTGNFHFESLSQNAAAENFTNSVRKEDF